jgi:hypothetical protein
MANCGVSTRSLNTTRRKILGSSRTSTSTSTVSDALNSAQPSPTVVEAMKVWMPATGSKSLTVMPRPSYLGLRAQRVLEHVVALHALGFGEGGDLLLHQLGDGTMAFSHR